MSTTNHNKVSDNHDHIEHDVLLGFDLPEGMSLSRGRLGVQVLNLSETIPYPVPSIFNPAGVGGELFLEPYSNDDKRKFIIPSNSSTLTTILNEASGPSSSFDADTQERGTVSLLGVLFRNLAHSLRRLVDVDGLIPTSLSYEQVLVVKDDFSFRLLPPLELEHLTSKSQVNSSWSKMVHLLMRSLNEGTTSDNQRNLVRALAKPVHDSFADEGKI